jgi:hypothetical protein
MSDASFFRSGIGCDYCSAQQRTVRDDLRLPICASSSRPRCDRGATEVRMRGRGRRPSAPTVSKTSAGGESSARRGIETVEDRLFRERYLQLRQEFLEAAFARLLPSPDFRDDGCEREFWQIESKRFEYAGHNRPPSSSGRCLVGATGVTCFRRIAERSFGDPFLRLLQFKLRRFQFSFGRLQVATQLRNQIERSLGADPIFRFIAFGFLAGIHAKFVNNNSNLEKTSLTDWTATFFDLRPWVSPTAICCHRYRSYQCCMNAEYQQVRDSFSLSSPAFHRGFPIASQSSPIFRHHTFLRKEISTTIHTIRTP